MHETNKPGLVRVFKPGKAIAVTIGAWPVKQKNGSIRIDLTGLGKGHTTVKSNPKSVRYHKTLFRDLRRTLIKEGCWPFGDEGSETER